MLNNYETYLGNKGYTILKKDLSVEKQAFIRSELSVTPHVVGSPVQSTSSFPAYRESSNKLYLPRYFGEQHFGKPKEFKISEGDTIDLSFNGELRDYQIPVIQKFLDYVKEGPSASGLLDLPCAWGKTSAALYLVSQLSKKTLVIVHKEFLLNQWIERIQQFLPNAKVGRIQGSVIDIENKDIVLGMLQSISMKDYPSSVFSSFGFTIIDEVHHISSETFSCALFKLVTKYMLGLSATMNRKDGTTKVFKYFLGNIIEKVVRKGEYDVEVRGLEYKTNDEEFNEVEYDFRGNPKFSTMITKLCSYNRRSEFIIKVVKDLLEENNKSQIMILAHNKSLLTYLYQGIEFQKIGSVGYYVGGMKEAALKESEKKQVIIATYAMASEALDIKTLTTLVMATPKTDIEQSVGRILREKHSKPIVVDIIDTHSIFQNQWVKRQKFYKGQKYKIIKSDNLHYEGTNTPWKIVSENGKSVKTQESNDLPSGKCLIRLSKVSG